MFTKLLLKYPGDLINHINEKSVVVFNDFNFRPVYFKKNTKNPKNFDEVKRTDVKGKAHTNTDGTKVITPHVHEKGKKNVRPAVKGQDY